MKYTSTRNNKLLIDSSEAIAKGISDDGGLFVPTSFPRVDLDFLSSLTGMTYIERARAVLPLFLTDFSKEEIEADTEGAYGTGFSSDKIAPTVNLHDGVNILELWHGPTCAFKDMALQLLPYLLTGSAKRVHDGKETVILVATSGDTGKAALEGFADVPGTRILVFYPNDGVSAMQKLQMTTQKGQNVGVSAIYGNFDDAQTAVKQIFTDAEIKKELEKNNMTFSSANSINWGRLVPQVIYYFSAYADMINAGQIKAGEKINIVVPTGNFGNILAAYYASEMGMPVNKLICASNANDVLTEFLTTGRYNRKRTFRTTVSPSMDILISSNLERLIYHLSGNDSDLVAKLYRQLSEDGEFTVPDEILSEIKKRFAAGCCDDEATKAVIGETFSKYGYLSDTHTGVAIRVYNDYAAKTGDATPVVIASTASPYKFCPAVLEGISGAEADTDDSFVLIDRLEDVSKMPAPAQLKGLNGKAPHFNSVVSKEGIRGFVFDSLGIK